MKVQLGNTPQRLQVNLTRDSAFYADIINDDGLWEDCTISLQLGIQVWNAQLDGEHARFAIDAAEVNTVIESGQRTATLTYNQAETIVWARGEVFVR